MHEDVQLFVPAYMNASGVKQRLQTSVVKKLVYCFSRTAKNLGSVLRLCKFVVMHASMHASTHHASGGHIGRETRISEKSTR